MLWISKIEQTDNLLNNLKIFVVLVLSCFFRYLHYDDDFKNLINESGEYKGLKYLSQRKYLSILFSNIVLMKSIQDENEQFLLIY